MRTALILTLSLLAADSLHAFPPAPHHEVYGTVRDESGSPLLGGASVKLKGASADILKGAVDPRIAPGVNYSLKVPMDAGTLSQLYQSTAMRPAMPFTAEVVIGGVAYVPIEVQGGPLSMGEPGGRTRLDLTLGVDSDGDGLPDAWEQEVIAAVDGIDTLADVTKEGDSDGDGVSNYIEYIAGTYAFDERAVFRLDIVEVKDGMARLRFLAVRGRSYSVTASEDGKGFEPVEFSFEPDGSAGHKVHLADSIRYQDIYISAEAAEGRLFKLHVR